MAAPHPTSHQVGDVESITISRDIVDQLNGTLLGFDFRNGPLRRKYDGIKYALRKLEDILYEQSLLSKVSGAMCGGMRLPSRSIALYCVAVRLRCECVVGVCHFVLTRHLSAYHTPQTTPRTTQRNDDDDDDGSKEEGGSCSKKPRVEHEVAPRLDVAEFEALRLRLEEADAAREKVIKGCRDGQKLAKQAIYAIHRGNFDTAEKQLNDSVAKLVAFDPIIAVHPTLRPGSYSNVLEEYAEGMIFLHWMRTREILYMGAMPRLKHEEYIGGIVDFTGEIGRFAVACATRRDADDVQKCFETMCVIHEQITLMSLPGHLKKKCGAVSNNLQKVSNLRYEIALAQAGRNLRSPPASSSTSAPKGSGGADDAVDVDATD